MVNFCSVANCLNSSRNRPDLSFFCFPSEQNSRRVWKNFCRRNDPEFRGQKTPGFAVHISRLPPSKIPLAGEEKLFQVNCRSILITQQTKVLFLLVKKDWMIGRNEHLMSNVLNLKRVGRLQRKAKIPGSQQATRQFFWITIIVNVF